MKKHLLTIFLILTVSNLFSQTVFWSENFGVGCNQAQSAIGFNGGNGGWNVTGGPTSSSTDAFFVSATEAGMGVGNCSDGCLSSPTLNNRTLHVSLPISTTPTAVCPSGDCGAIYNPSIICAERAESPFINCSGKYGLSLNFDFIHFGDATNDYAELWVYCPVIGPLSLPSWQSLGILPKTNCANSVCNATTVCNGLTRAVWSAYTVNLPPGASNYMAVQIGFKWNNNGDTIGTDPSFAVDNISVSAATITAIQQISVNNDIYKVYPNPAADMVCVESGSFDAANIELIDAFGRVLRKEKTDFKKVSVHKLNISELNSGIYFIKIISGDKQSPLVKIIKE